MDQSSGVPVKTWKVNVKKTDGTVRQIHIDRGDTVRKLYTTVKKDWNFNNSFQLYNNKFHLIKNDGKITCVDLYDGITLLVYDEPAKPYTWDLFVKLEEGSHCTITIAEEATVRKLYTTVKSKCSFKNSFELCIDSSPLTKDDETLKNVTGLKDGMTLHANAKSGPYTWDLFIQLKGTPQLSYTVTIDENKACSELYKEVKQVVHDGTSQPICIMDAAEDEVSNDDTKLCNANYLYDGAILVSQIETFWNLMVLVQNNGSQNLTISVPRNSTVQKVYEVVKEKVNIPTDFRLITGTKELDDAVRDKKIKDVDISDGSNIIVVMRQKGGNFRM